MYVIIIPDTVVIEIIEDGCSESDDAAKSINLMFIVTCVYDLPIFFEMEVGTCRKGTAIRKSMTYIKNSCMYKIFT